MIAHCGISSLADRICINQDVIYRTKSHNALTVAMTNTVTVSFPMCSHRFLNMVMTNSGDRADVARSTDNKLVAPDRWFSEVDCCFHCVQFIVLLLFYCRAIKEGTYILQLGVR